MSAINTPYAVLSFPSLFTPRPRSEGGDPVYSCSLLFSEAEQRTEAFKKMQEAVKRVAVEKWGDKVNLSSLATPFRDAGEKADKYAGYEEGVLYINPWSKNKPGVVDARLQDVMSADDVFAGMIVRANVVPFAWMNSGRKGVSFGLNHIQIIRSDVPRIDGRASASKVFDAVEEVDASAPF